MSAAKYLLGAGVVALAPVIAVAKGRGVAASTTPSASSAPRVESPPRVRAEGRIVARPGARVTVSAEQSGRIVHLLTTENAEVHQGDLIAELDSELTRAEMAQAQKKLEDAKEQGEFLKKELDRAERMLAAGVIAEKEVTRQRHEVKNAATRLEQAESEVARLEIVLKRTKLWAPISGIVTQRSVSEGETLAPGSPVVTIVDLARLRVEAEVDEIDAPGLSAGTEVTIAAEAAPGKSWRGSIEQVPGTVVRRDLRGEETERPQDMPVLLVKIALAEPVPLRLGQEVSVFLGPEPLPVVRPRVVPERDSFDFTEPAAALLMDPMTRETASAALTTILGTLFFVLVRRKLREKSLRDDEDDADQGDRLQGDEPAREDDSDEHESDPGALDGVASEDEIYIFDDSDNVERERRPLAAASSARHRTVEP